VQDNYFVKKTNIKRKQHWTITSVL